MDIYSEHQKYQRERLQNERREQRELLSLPTPFKSYTAEEVKSYIHLMEDQKTLIDGISKLTSLCSEAMVTFTLSQASFFIDIFANVSTNPTITDQMLNLIDKALQYEKIENVRHFSTEKFLQIFFAYKTSKYTLNSLYHIVNSDIISARLILNHLNEGSEISPETLLMPNAYNLELNIRFLSAFSKYEEEEFTIFISNILTQIFKLSQLGIRNSSVRNACLIFLKNALFMNEQLVDKIAYHQFFPTTFQSPPKTRRERILMLNLLNLVASYTKDAIQIIVENNLLPFVIFSMKMGTMKIEKHIENENENEIEEENIKDDDTENNFFDVAVASLDCLREIASCGKKATEILYEFDNQFHIFNDIWNFMDDNNQINLITAAIMTFLEIIKYSPIEDQNSLAESGLFEILANYFEVLPQVFLEKTLNNLKEIIKIADEEANQKLLNTLLGSKSLMTKLEELCNDEDEKQLNSICFEILERAKAEKNSE